MIAGGRMMQTRKVPLGAYWLDVLSDSDLYRQAD